MIKRRFVQVGSRRVHYRRAGKGPPAILIHSSPADSRLLIKEFERLADAHTVFAFDTPGFGLSDPLPGETLTVSNLADALADTLEAIAMPRCPVFGTHTGAAIALELGVRHPDRVTGLVLDGVAIFTDVECAAFFRDYFRVLPLSDLGGHYAETWTRFRDQSVWFPWCERLPEHLNPYDLSPPQSTHLWVQMYFEGAENYAPAYRAATFYGARAIAAVRELDVPVTFCAAETDMLYPHLDRLPPLKPGQAIVPIGTSHEYKRDLIAERFVTYGANGPAPADQENIASSPTIERQFVDGTAGQIHVRYAGDRALPPLLLFHDAPGSAEQAEPQIATLATRFFVIAPDLPGCGESDAFPSTPGIEAYAAEAKVLLDRLGLEAVIAYGIGFGASAALAFSRGHARRVTALAVQGVLLPDAEERADLTAHYAPQFAIEPDGAHWYRTWLMLRDSQVFWPWYDRRLAAHRKVPADFSPRPLHRWTMDVMRAPTSCRALIIAALADDAAAALADFALPLIQVHDVRTPLSAYDDRLAAIRWPEELLNADTYLAEALAAATMREMQRGRTSRDIGTAGEAAQPAGTA